MANTASKTTAAPDTLDIERFEHMWRLYAYAEFTADLRPKLTSSNTMEQSSSLGRHLRPMSGSVPSSWKASLPSDERGGPSTR